MQIIWKTSVADDMAVHEFHRRAPTLPSPGVPREGEESAEIVTHPAAQKGGAPRRKIGYDFIDAGESTKFGHHAKMGRGLIRRFYQGRLKTNAKINAIGIRAIRKATDIITQKMVVWTQSLSSFFVLFLYFFLP